MRRLIVLALATPMIACVRPVELDLRSALDRGETNPAAVMEAYRKKKVLIHGVVRKLGVSRQSHVEHEYTIGGVVASGESRRVTTFHPHAYVAPLDGQPGSAVCYFDKNRDVAILEPGTRVDLECAFQEFARTDEPLLVLRHCEFSR